MAPADGAGVADCAGDDASIERETASAIPPLHSLVAFETIARHRSVSAAARDLGVTRSALAHSINLLEYRLQVRLLRRTHPTVELTRAGMSYLNAVRDFGSTLGDSLYRLSPDARTTLRLVVCPALARLWLGARLVRFHHLHPRIDLNVTIAQELTVDALDRTDVVVHYGAARAEQVLAMPLWRETVVAVASPSLAAQASNHDIQQFHGRFPLIETKQFSWSGWLREPLAGRAMQHAALVTPDVVYSLEMAALGMGIALAPRRLAARYFESGRLVVANAHEEAGRYYEAMTLESNANRAPVSAFLGWLAGAAHESAG